MDTRTYDLLSTALIFDKPRTTSRSHNEEGNPITVAYAVSFIECKSSPTKIAALTDASLVLRHSIHKISSRNPNSGSKYDYKMYAFVHKRRAIKCIDAINSLGFEVVFVAPPFEINDLQDEFVRWKMPLTVNYGHHEFIKLHAYNLTEEIFVHTDLDFSFRKPMDHLFDAILYDKDSSVGQAARDKLELQYPEETNLPDRIDAFITRDWSQTSPGRGWKSGFQAGFIVARRDPSVITDVVRTVTVSNYTPGFHDQSGWEGLGYGSFIQGSLTNQGFMAYFYDVIRPNTTVELNACRFNHLGMDMKFNWGGPWFNRKSSEHGGKCRDGRKTCEQCKSTALENIYSIHYSPCGSPWNCMTKHRMNDTAYFKKWQVAYGAVDLDHCSTLHRDWHELRSDFENELRSRTDTDSFHNMSNGQHEMDTYMGHCRNESEYISLIEFAEQIREITSEMYDP